MCEKLHPLIEDFVECYIIEKSGLQTGEMPGNGVGSPESTHGVGQGRVSAEESNVGLNVADVLAGDGCLVHLVHYTHLSWFCIQSHNSY